MKWKVDIKGERCGGTWEISVIREDNVHGLKSYGWFDDSKLLISHNGGPCHDPLIGYVFDRQIEIAEEVALRLNSEESVDVKA